MEIKDFLTIDRIAYKSHATSKKNTLELISELIANDFTNIQKNDIFDALIEREKLGSTGLSDGIAIPHARLKNADSMIGALILLDEPIDFDSIDKKWVDLLFVLIVPEDDNATYLEVLSHLAEKLRDSSYQNHLRHAKSKDELFERAIGN